MEEHRCLFNSRTTEIFKAYLKNTSEKEERKKYRIDQHCTGNLICWLLDQLNVNIEFPELWFKNEILCISWFFKEYTF